MTYHRPAWYRRSREGFRDDAVRQEKKKQPSQRAITHFACQPTMAEAHRNSTTYIINSTSLDPIHNKIVKPAEKPLSWARPSCLNSRSFFKIAVMQHRERGYERLPALSAVYRTIAGQHDSAAKISSSRFTGRRPIPCGISVPRCGRHARVNLNSAIYARQYRRYQPFRFGMKVEMTLLDRAYAAAYGTRWSNANRRGHTLLVPR